MRQPDADMRARPGWIAARLVAAGVTAVLVFAACGEDGIELPDVSTTGGDEAAPTTEGDTGTPETTAPETTGPEDPGDGGSSGPELTAPDATLPGGDAGSESATTAPATTAPATTAASQTTTTTQAGDVEAAETTDADEEETPWGWILLILAAVLALVVVVIVVLRRGGDDDAQEAEWWQRAGGACTDAKRVADLIPDPAGTSPGPDDAERARAVSNRAREVEQRLGSLVSSAPDDATARAIFDLQDGLSSLEFTADADRLLRTRDTPPTAEQLQQSAQSLRERRVAFDSALANATALVSQHRGTTAPAAEPGGSTQAP